MPLSRRTKFIVSSCCYRHSTYPATASFAHSQYALLHTQPVVTLWSRQRWTKTCHCCGMLQACSIDNEWSKSSDEVGFSHYDTHIRTKQDHTCYYMLRRINPSLLVTKVYLYIFTPHTICWALTPGAWCMAHAQPIVNALTNHY